MDNNFYNNENDNNNMQQDAGYTPPQYDMGYNQAPYSDKGKPPKVKKPMTKGKLAAIIIGSVVAVAAVVCCVIIIPKFLKSDKEVVIDAFENTFASENSDSYMENVLGINDINDALFKTGATGSTTISIDKILGKDIGSFDINFLTNYDPLNEQISSGAEVVYDGCSLFSYKLIGDAVTTYLQLPDMIDGYISIPNDLSQFAESPLFENSDLSAADIYSFIDYFPESESGTDINAHYVDAVEELWDSVTVEKQGRAKISVNDENINAKEYYVTLPEEAIENAASSALEGMRDIILADIELYETSYDMDADTLEDSIDQVQKMIPSLINGDLIVKVYVADGKVVKIDASDKITIMYVDLQYDAYIDIGDNDVSGKLSIEAMGSEVGIKFEANDIHNNMNGSVSIYAPGDNLDITFNTTNNSSDTKKDVQYDAALSYNSSELFSVGGAYSFDQSSNSGQMSAELTAEAVSAIYVEADFEYTDINKGVGYTLDVNNIEVLLDGENLATLSYVNTVDTSVVDAETIDTDLTVYDLSTMSESDFENMILDNADNMNIWLNNIIDNGGFIGETLQDLFYGYSVDDAYIYDGDYYDDADDDISVDYSSDDMTLVSGDHKVQITGCIDGFDLDYACEYFIDYYDNNYSMIEYTLETDTTMETILDGILSYTTGDAEVSNETIDVNGETIHYSMTYYDETNDTKYYIFVKDMGDGSFLSSRVILYASDAEYTIEELAGSLDSQYYTIIQ